MTLIRDPKNVWCHMICTERTINGRREFGAGQITTAVYATRSAAVADLKALARYLKEETKCQDIYDFTNDGKFACLEWTDDLCGKRFKRFVTDLPFYHG